MPLLRCSVDNRFAAFVRPARTALETPDVLSADEPNVASPDLAAHTPSRHYCQTANRRADGPKRRRGRTLARPVDTTPKHHPLRFDFHHPVRPDFRRAAPLQTHSLRCATESEKRPRACPPAGEMASSFKPSLLLFRQDFGYTVGCLRPITSVRRSHGLQATHIPLGISTSRTPSQ